MTVVIVDYEGPHAHGLRHVGRGHERRERRELVPEMVRDEVVADEKGRVPEPFGLTRLADPGIGRLHAFIEHTESEVSRRTHGVRPFERVHDGNVADAWIHLYRGRAPRLFRRPMGTVFVVPRGRCTAHSTVSGFQIMSCMARTAS